MRMDHKITSKWTVDMAGVTWRNFYVSAWLAGWQAGCLSVTAVIVSKRLNLSENFFDLLVAPSQ